MGHAPLSVVFGSPRRGLPTRPNVRIRKTVRHGRFLFAGLASGRYLYIGSYLSRSLLRAICPPLCDRSTPIACIVFCLA
jgi:hypothetical protein